jgi:hypothetical protein
MRRRKPLNVVVERRGDALNLVVFRWQQMRPADEEMNLRSLTPRASAYKCGVIVGGE